MSTILKLNKRYILLLIGISVSLFTFLFFHFRNTAAKPAPALPVRDLPSYWPTPVEQAVCQPKIYVYKAPSNIQVPLKIQQENATSLTTISEIILHNQLTDPNSAIYQHYVTENPEEADFFFIPFSAAVISTTVGTKTTGAGTRDVTLMLAMWTH
ncbi:unnamed protein product [Rhizopus stolonifer]